MKDMNNYRVSTVGKGEGHTYHTFREAFLAFSGDHKKGDTVELQGPVESVPGQEFKLHRVVIATTRIL